MVKNNFNFSKLKLFDFLQLSNLFNHLNHFIVNILFICNFSIFLLSLVKFMSILRKINLI